MPKQDNRKITEDDVVRELMGPNPSFNERGRRVGRGASTRGKRDSGIPVRRKTDGGMINPMTAEGQMIAGGEGGAPYKVPAPTSAGLVLKSVEQDGLFYPEWGADAFSFMMASPMHDGPVAPRSDVLSIRLGGSAPTLLYVPYNAEISEWLLLSPAPVTAQFDIRAGGYEDYPFARQDSISGEYPPFLAGRKNRGNDLTGWRPFLPKNTILSVHPSKAVDNVLLVLRVELA